MKIRNLFKSRLVFFCIQILLLIVFNALFNYKFQIDFDVNLDPRATEQQFVIQFLANIIMYNNIFGFLYIISTWIIVSLIPILIYRDFKKAYSTNLTIFFFPTFFFYVFYWRYSETSFMAQLSTLILNTLLIGLTIVIMSIILSLLLKYLTNFRRDSNQEDLEKIESLNRTICPNCGTQFNSNPKYCFNCNTVITNELEENIENGK